jgi:hypothetical protein
VGYRSPPPSQNRAQTWPDRKLESIHPQNYPHIVCFYIPVQGLSRPRRLCQTLHGLPFRIGMTIARKESDQRQESALPPNSRPTEKLIAS